jgi:hypothetical protein
VGRLVGSTPMEGLLQPTSPTSNHLVVFGMGFPSETPDPQPEILSAPAGPESAT